MQKLSSEFIGLPVVSVQSSDELGRVTGLIIKSEDLKIVLCEVLIPTTRTQHFLLPRDIRFFNEEKVLVDSIQNITEFDDLVRYQHTITDNYELLGKRVETTTGKKLGRVRNFTFDPTHFMVNKLHVKPNIFKSLMVTSLLIDRSSIIETKKDVIVVKENYAKVKKTAPVALPLQG